jgi:hypothetical protein
MSTPRIVFEDHADYFNVNIQHQIKDKLLAYLPPYLNKAAWDTLIKYDSDKLGTTGLANLTYISSLLELYSLSLAYVLKYLIDKTKINYQCKVNFDAETAYIDKTSRDNILAPMFDKFYFEKYVPSDDPKKVGATKELCVSIEEVYTAINNVSTAVKTFHRKYLYNIAQGFYTTMEINASQLCSDILCIDRNKMNLLNAALTVATATEDEKLSLIMNYFSSCVEIGLYIYSWYQKSFPFIVYHTAKERPEDAELFDNNKFSQIDSVNASSSDRVDKLLNKRDLLTTLKALRSSGREEVQTAATLVEHSILLAKKHSAYLDSLESIRKRSQVIFADKVKLAILNAQLYNARVAKMLTKVSMVTDIVVSLLTSSLSPQPVAVALQEKLMTEAQKKVLIKKFNRIITDLKNKHSVLKNNLIVLNNQCEALATQLRQSDAEESLILNKLGEINKKAADIATVFNQINNKNHKFSETAIAEKNADLSKIEKLDKELIDLKAELLKLEANQKGLKNRKAKAAKQAKAAERALKSAQLQSPKSATSVADSIEDSTVSSESDTTEPDSSSPTNADSVSPIFSESNNKDAEQSVDTRQADATETLAGPLVSSNCSDQCVSAATEEAQTTKQEVANSPAAVELIATAAKDGPTSDAIEPAPAIVTAALPESFSPHYFNFGYGMGYTLFDNCFTEIRSRVPDPFLATPTLRK